MPFDDRYPEPLVSPDTNNATDFHYQEIEEEYPYHDIAYQNKREKFRLLRNYNTGISQREWSDQEKLRHIDNLASFDAVSSQLGLEKSQKRLGRRLYSRLDFRTLGRRVELVAFCVCAHVCNNDKRVFRDAFRRHRSNWKRYHPQRNPENNDETYEKVAESINLERGRLQSCMAKLRQELPDWLFDD
jgi:hypothetical protein